MFSWHTGHRQPPPSHFFKSSHLTLFGEVADSSGPLPRNLQLPTPNPNPIHIAPAHLPRLGGESVFFFYAANSPPSHILQKKNWVKLGRGCESGRRTLTKGQV